MVRQATRQRDGVGIVSSARPVIERHVCRISEIRLWSAHGAREMRPKLAGRLVGKHGMVGRSADGVVVVRVSVGSAGGGYK